MLGCFPGIASSRNPAAGSLAEPGNPEQFALATVHRAENTDDPERLRRNCGGAR